MSHNATIIEVLLGLTLLVIIFLSIRIFLVEKDPQSAGGGSVSNLDLGQLEKSLKEILEKAGQVPSLSAAGDGGGAGSEDSQKLSSEISQLKAELQTKQKQIEELRMSSASAAASAPSGMSDAEKSKLEDQLKELQAKLSEYEIISEDIADLSFYKEQNAKLQKEMEALKAGGAVAAATPAPAPAAAAPAPAPAVEAAAPVAPPAPAEVQKPEPEIVGVAVATEAAFQEESSAAPASDAGVDDDLMAEFAAAVEKQKTGGAEVDDTSAAFEAAAAAAEASASATAASEAPAEAEIDLGQMDMEKMLAEAAVIKADGPDVGVEEALGVAVDENKLLQEAAALEGGNPVSSEEKKLMGEFENFVKKNES